MFLKSGKSRVDNTRCGREHSCLAGSSGQGSEARTLDSAAGAANLFAVSLAMPKFGC
jgi:hypothetical protein